MSWLEKLLPPKIQHTDPADRRSLFTARTFSRRTTPPSTGMNGGP